MCEGEEDEASEIGDFQKGGRGGSDEYYQRGFRAIWPGCRVCRVFSKRDVLLPKHLFSVGATYGRLANFEGIDELVGSFGLCFLKENALALLELTVLARPTWRKFFVAMDIIDRWIICGRRCYVSQLGYGGRVYV